MKKIFNLFAITTSLVSAATNSTNTTEDLTTNHDRACQLYGDGDFTHFNLTTLGKKGEDDYIN